MPEQEQVPQAVVESLRNLEWAKSCSPTGPSDDSVEWAEMRLAALWPEIRDKVLSEVWEALDPLVDAIYEVGSIPDVDEVGAPQDIDGPALWRAVDALQRKVATLTDQSSTPVVEECKRCGGETYIDQAPSTFGGHPKVRCPDCAPKAKATNADAGGPLVKEKADSFNSDQEDPDRIRGEECKCCANCVEVKPDVVTLPDWPAGCGPCDLCLACICLLYDSAKRSEPLLPASTVDEMEIADRRMDPEFRARLERSVEENAELLERLGAEPVERTWHPATGKKPADPSPEPPAFQHRVWRPIVLVGSKLWRSNPLDPKEALDAKAIAAYRREPEIYDVVEYVPVIPEEER